MKRILLTLAALLTIGGGSAYLIANQPEPTPQVSVQQQVEKEINYQGVEGKNALELLKSNYDVKTEDFPGFGEMVKTIDGKTPTDKQFWGFYVNGEMAQVGAGDYITKASDKITWKIENIE